jgi:hypothetical protein
MLMVSGYTLYGPQYIPYVQKCRVREHGRLITCHWNGALAVMNSSLQPQTHKNTRLVCLFHFITYESYRSHIQNAFTTAVRAKH